ncbi:hypothetical protein ACJRO7_022003 [Eucalyptus globulus]|uniref:F-box associated beta-propeller type 1 domain-containing protein n=1 Tax=Eucalyptus globulus TaxID=34317 RepID=A0ABD3KRI3_EUCGL
MAWTLGLFREHRLSLCHIDQGSLTDEVERQYPWQWRYVRLLGSCRSTLCIANVADYEVGIWDPIFDRHSILPPADAGIPHELGLFVYGFGYNEWNDEFVLLRLVQTMRRPIVSEVSIYKSKANVWRRFEGMPYFLIEPGGMGVYLRGRLHWLMRREGMRNSAKVLVAFDIRTESFVEVDLPNVIDNRLRMDLAVLEEHLYLIIYGEPGVVDVWIMREYGLNRPWDMLFSLRDHWWSFRRVWPLAYSQDGRQVLVEVGSETKTLGWYNLRTNEVEQLHHINGMPRSFNAATCLL